MLKRLVISSLLVVGAACIGTPARADTLTRDEMVRLDRRETVIREQTFERGDRRFIGGVTYAVMDASNGEIAAILDNVESLKHVLPRTKRARLAGVTANGDQLLEMATGNAVMEAEYTLRVRREPRDPQKPGETEVRFWLDPSRPHGIDDAWGFFRYSPFIGPNGEERVLLTYAVLVDVGPGIVRDLFEERVRSALLSVPQLIRRQVAERKVLGAAEIYKRTGYSAAPRH